MYSITNFCNKSFVRIRSTWLRTREIISIFSGLLFLVRIQKECNAPNVLLIRGYYVYICFWRLCYRLHTMYWKPAYQRLKITKIMNINEYPDLKWFPKSAKSKQEINSYTYIGTRYVYALRKMFNWVSLPFPFVPFSISALLIFRFLIGSCTESGNSIYNVLHLQKYYIMRNNFLYHKPAVSS